MSSPSRPARPQVVTVGHAIVDVLAPVADELVASFGLEKGTMTLVEEELSQSIFGALGKTTTVAGGSAANTAVGLASFGVGAAFVGKVRDDELGRSFAAGMVEAGVTFEVPIGTTGAGTGRCLIMVTPDAERTMCTTLGIGDHVGPDDIAAGQVAAADVLYFEGYLCGLQHTDPTIDRAITEARSAGTEVALSLSDPFWVELHTDELAALVERVDLVFGNAQEAMLITGRGDVDAAVADLAKRAATVVVTLGAGGAVVAWDGKLARVPAERVDPLVDTTGAGDLFAAGFLAGRVRGYDPPAAARLGALASAEVISHFGARPVVSLAERAAAAGLLTP